MSEQKSFDTRALNALGIDVALILGPGLELRHFSILPNGELDISIHGDESASNTEQAEHRADVLTEHVLAALKLGSLTDYRTNEIEIKRTMGDAPFEG